MNKKSHTFLIIASICFLVSASTFAYVVFELRQKGAQFAESKQLIGENSAKEASFNTVERLLASTQEDRGLIKSYFINEKDTINFISEIEKNAQSIGVTLVTSELSIVNTSTDSNGATIPAMLIVGFDFTGAEMVTWKFLTLLENIPYHKKITQLSFVKSENNIWKANIKMQLTLQYD
jgi:hypothetical protein